MLAHLQNVHRDIAKEWTPKQREKALELYNVLTDEDFLILLNLQLDVLASMSTQSLIYQKKHGTLIGEYSKQKLFSMKLDSLRNGNSPNVMEFLNEVKCSNNTRQFNAYLRSKDSDALDSCGSIEVYESSKHKAINGHRLVQDSTSSFEPISTYLDNYTDTLVANHQKYMLQDEDFLQLFEELDQRLWKGVYISDGNDLVTLGKMFGLENPETIPITWFSLKKMIMDSPYYLSHFNDNPGIFWSALLQSDKFDIDPYLKKLIKNVLVLSPSSASAERLFSIMNHLRTHRRENLSVENTENQIRIRMNGKKS